MTVFEKADILFAEAVIHQNVLLCAEGFVLLLHKHGGVVVEYEARKRRGKVVTAHQELVLKKVVKTAEFLLRIRLEHIHVLPRIHLKVSES